MSSRDEVTDPTRFEEDRTLDLKLRPERLDDFPGQDKLKEKLSITIAAAKGRREPIDHLLFSGPPGLGKTTLAHIVAKEMGVNIKTTSGPVVERQADLSAVLTSLEDRDILFIDEIHRLNHVVEETLYPAMEDFTVDIMIGKGPSARSIKLSLKRFTLIGATTRAGLLTSPLRSRFGDTCRVSFYDLDDLKTIVLRSAKVLGVEIDDGGAAEIAHRSRGTPRIANRLLRRIRDYAEVKADGRIDRGIAIEALELLEIDDKGLDNTDKAIIRTIIEKFNGGPVGVASLAVAIGEEKGTIEEVHEPFLIQVGFIKRTAAGRVATELAFRHFQVDRGTGQQRSLWDDKEVKTDSE